MAFLLKAATGGGHMPNPVFILRRHGANSASCGILVTERMMAAGLPP